MSKETRKVQFIHAPQDKAENDTLTAKTISRNKPCPCGSGKKVKNCHPELMKKVFLQPSRDELWQGRLRKS